jgi:hypothetical protein
MDNNAVVHEFPAPPPYYVSFTDDSNFPHPPSIPTEDYEIYGGTVSAIPLIDTPSITKFRKEVTS